MLSVTLGPSLLVLVAAVLAAGRADGLRMITLDAPQTALQGDTIQLGCSFALQHPPAKQTSGPQKSKPPNQTDPSGEQVSKHHEAPGEQLYAIKWYKDESEFFRFLAQDRPRRQSFPLDGVLVDLDKSDNHTVVLRAVSLKTSGTFKCEVSTDAPSFVTKSKQHNLTVYSLPDRGPTMEPAKALASVSGTKSLKFQLNQTLEFVCRSAESKPPATIDWIINDSLNLSATMPRADGTALFQILDQRFVRLPKPAEGTRIASESFRVAPKQLVRVGWPPTALYQLHNGGLAVPANIHSDAAPIDLTNFINQMVEMSTSVIKFTVDSNFLQTISRTKLNNQMSQLKRNAKFSRTSTPDPQSSLTEPDLPKSVSVDVNLYERFRETNITTLEHSNLRRSRFTHSSPLEMPFKSNAKSEGRAPINNLALSKAKDDQKFIIKLKCVARTLHLAMSDEFKLKLMSKLTPGQGDQAISIGAQSRQTLVDRNSGGSRYLEKVGCQICMILLAVFFIIHSRVD